MLSFRCRTRSRLGVVIDSQLTFADNVKKLAGVASINFVIQLRAVRRSLTTDAATTLVHSLISSRVDYCNSYGVCEVYLRPLQSVLNAARDSSPTRGSLTILPALYAMTSIGSQ